MDYSTKEKAWGLAALGASVLAAGDMLYHGEHIIVAGFVGFAAGCAVGTIKGAVDYVGVASRVRKIMKRSGEDFHKLASDAERIRGNILRRNPDDTSEEWQRYADHLEDMAADLRRV